MSFSRAAEAVERSQSTISQQILKLETQVGKALLRAVKGACWNSLARVKRFAQYARRILQLNDEACASMREDALAGFVKLGVALNFLGRDFTAWLARFKRQKHVVSIEVEANQSDLLMK